MPTLRAQPMQRSGVLPPDVPVPFRRALVIGSPGAGKSTFARQLGAITGLPVTHIDQLFWEPGWVQTPTPVYEQRLDAVLAQPRWIIDGINTATLPRRLAGADVMFWLDRNRVVCLTQLLSRVARNYGRVRPDMAAGCPEPVPDLEFVRFIWTFDQVYRPRINAAIKITGAANRTIMLTSHRQSAACLAEIRHGFMTMAP
jgi:adenylate kinase family enzyme